MSAIFHPGKILMTPGATDAIKRAGQKPSEFVLRHVKMEQGELCNSDHRENLSAMKTGLRIFNHYKTALGVKLWVISEWVDVKDGGDPKKRETTTILIPSEY